MLTKYIGALLLLFSSGAILAASEASGANECASLTTPTKYELIRLARFRYGIDESIPLQVEGKPDQDCFIHARVMSSDSEHNFLKVFTVTPDQRHTVTELTDLLQDPETAAQRAHQELIRKLAPDNAPIRGDSHAPVTIVIFSDFQCPFCRRAAELLNTEIASEARAKIVFRQFPLSIHDWARTAAEASTCIARQQPDLFWTAHDFLFEHQNEISRDNIIELLNKVLTGSSGFNIAAFHQCLNSGSAREAVQDDIAFGLENNVRATPTVFVNGRKVIWAGNSEQIKSLILQASRPAPDR